MLAPALFLSSVAATSACDEGRAPPFTLNGYAEAYYQWNFNMPSNGITAFRAFDNRHNSITLQNAELQASWDVVDVVGVVALQVGAVGASSYAAETAAPGAGGVAPTDGGLFRFLQQANVGYRFPVLSGLVVKGGVFLSPIGPEGIAVKDNWNWSRSDVWFALPVYHAGAQATLSIDDHWSTMLMVTNGINDIVDNNDGKSFALAVSYAGDTLSGQAIYYGGPERAKGAPEGDGSWRNIGDVYVVWSAFDRLSLLAHSDAGLESNAFGQTTWLAGAVAARAQVLPELFVAARVDGFAEQPAKNAEGEASHIFWPGTRVGSGTATLDYQPADGVSFRLEYRHDLADAPTYFRGEVRDDVTPNALSQDTLTVGATAWF